MEYLTPYLLLDEQINDHILGQPFDYLNGSFPVDKHGRINFPNEKVPLSTIKLNNLTILDYIKCHNDEEYLRLLSDEKIVLGDIEEDGELPKYTGSKGQLTYIRLVKSVFKFWYRTNSHEFLKLPRITSMTKKDEFYEEFVKLVESDTATEENVRQVLYDKERWKNGQSAYMAMTKSRYGISTAELKNLPHFSFIDPKGTAKG